MIQCRRGHLTSKFYWPECLAGTTGPPLEVLMGEHDGPTLNATAMAKFCA